jgi:hypothetical protein
MVLRKVLLQCGLLAFVGGCSTSTGVGDATRCPDGGGEFASYGCAVVAGLVRDASGHGLPAATVTVTGSPECGACFGITTVADANGSFRVLPQRYAPPPGLPVRDSVSATVTVLATGGYPRPSGDTYYSDSTSIVLVFAAIGAPQAKASEVTLTINLP